MAARVRHARGEFGKYACGKPSTHSTYAYPTCAGCEASIAKAKAATVVGLPSSVVEVLARSTIVPRLGEAPGEIVLCRLNGSSPFVVWFHNTQTGGCSGGEYCQEYGDAVNEFTRQMLLGVRA